MLERRESRGSRLAALSIMVFMSMDMYIPISGMMLCITMLSMSITMKIPPGIPGISMSVRVLAPFDRIVMLAVIPSICIRKVIDPWNSSCATVGEGRISVASRVARTAAERSMETPRWMAGAARACGARTGWHQCFVRQAPPAGPTCRVPAGGRRSGPGRPRCHRRAARSHREFPGRVGLPVPSPCGRSGAAPRPGSRLPPGWARAQTA